MLTCVWKWRWRGHRDGEVGCLSWTQSAASTTTLPLTLTPTQATRTLERQRKQISTSKILPHFDRPLEVLRETATVMAAKCGDAATKEKTGVRGLPTRKVLSFATPKRPFGGQASAAEALLLIPLKVLSAWNAQLRRRGGGIAVKAKSIAAKPTRKLLGRVCFRVATVKSPVNDGHFVHKDQCGQHGVQKSFQLSVAWYPRAGRMAWCRRHHSGSIGGKVMVTLLLPPHILSHISQSLHEYGFLVHCRRKFSDTFLDNITKKNQLFADFPPPGASAPQAL
ncbi:hypothetical protein C8J57DRAFT_1244099 [Mycena rebaudengoi]|nr:hypothetical protein C8J57DRAFT_1244099 [Mycena rebaudengoi]